MMRNDRTGSQHLACWFENSLEGQVLYWGMTGLSHSVWNACSKNELEGQVRLIALGVSVRKWF